MNISKNDFYDIIIIGGGPSGLTAAIYAARARYKVLVIEKGNFGGQISITSDVVNYPGIIQTSGSELSNTMRKQAENFGAEFLAANVNNFDLATDIKTIKTDKGDFTTFGVIIATGANPKTIGFKGESEFRGRGVGYCATCDGEFFTGLDVFVIGGGFAAAEEGLFLTTYAKSVKILVRKDKFRCADSVVEHLSKNEKIEIYYNTELIEAGGDGMLSFAKIKNNKTGETWEYNAEKGSTFGIFVFAGYDPATEIFKGIIDLDKTGYVITDKNQKTNIDGVYAGGDVCIKPLRQIVTAVSDGAIAATSLEKYVSEQYDRLNMERTPIEVVKPSNDDTPPTTSHSSKDAESEGFISEDIKRDLAPIFEKFESSITIKAYLDNGKPSEDVRNFLNEFKPLTNKVNIEIIKETDGEYVPSMKFYNSDGEYTGVSFNALPGGHEFNSFVLALYNIAGPGQPLESAVIDQIKNIDKKVNIKVIISLECTMCPDLVVASHRLALLNKNIEAQTFDVYYFPSFREKYKIMSVPCLVLNDEIVEFGKKTIPELISLINEKLV